MALDTAPRTYISLSEAAKLLGWHRQTVKLWASQGRLPGVLSYQTNPTRRRYQVDRAVLEGWIREHTTAG